MSNYEQILNLYPKQKQITIEAAFHAPYNLLRRLLPHYEPKSADKTKEGSPRSSQIPESLSHSIDWGSLDAAIVVGHGDSEILLLPPAFDVPHEELAAQESSSSASQAKEGAWFNIPATEALLFTFIIPLLLCFVLKYLFVTMIAGVGPLYFQLFVAFTFILIGLLSPLMMLWWRQAHNRTVGA
ncbi:MAG: hypothetical protein ACPGWR_17650 [Ardenticatenaceae bacterium]